MPKTFLKYILIYGCLCLFTLAAARAQEVVPADSVPLVQYMEQLETEFDIKFSYADQDIRNLYVHPPQGGSLAEILQHIEGQTQLLIKSLNNRYYTLSRKSTLDICARILDNFGQNTVAGASVEVLESDISITTDADGYFSLENIPREATLHIRHLGFKPRFESAESLAARPCMEILLGIHYQQLEEVVLFHILTTGINRNPDGSISISTDEFGLLPGLIEPDVLQTVQALPGIRSVDETVSDINIRGGTNDQNLLLWDDIKMYQSGHFFGLISAFNPYLTDEVTLIKNGTSAQYGEGVSGIIKMDTQDEIGMAVYGGAGFNLISGDAYVHLPLSEDFAMQFSARRSVTDFLNTPTYDQFFNRAFQDSQINTAGPGGSPERAQEEDFYFYDLSAKFLYDLNPYHKLRVSLIHINNDLDYVETNTDTGNFNQSRLDQTNFSFGGSLESEWNSNFSSRLTAYYTRYNLDAEIISDNGRQQLFQNNQVLESSVKLHTQYRINEQLGWVNGYQFTETGITNFTSVSQPPFNSNVKGVLRIHAPYSEVMFGDEEDILQLTAGARLNFIENLSTFSDIILEPRARMQFRITGDFSTEVKGEFKNQATNQVIDLEQNFLGIEKRRWILSDNQSLPVTTSKQLSWGFNYDDGHWYLGLEAFYKDVDGISTATQGFKNQDQFDGEIGSYTVKGAEFLVNHKSRAISSWLSYTFNSNNYTFPEIIPVTFPNNLDIRHTATLAGTYTANGLSMGVGLNYRSGKPYTEPQPEPNSIDRTVVPNAINYQYPNSSRLPDYLRADASASYEFEMGEGLKASAGASILNIFNKKNLLNTYFRLDEQNEIEKIERISLGLTPNLSFRLEF